MIFEASKVNKILREQLLKEQLNQHERRHNNIRRHACEYCDKRFRTGSDLREHIRTHTGEKLYKCDHCDYACIQKGNLKKHVNNRHKDIISNAL